MNGVQQRGGRREQNNFGTSFFLSFLFLLYVSECSLSLSLSLSLNIYIYIYMHARSWCDGSLDRSFMVDPLSYFSFQPVFHDWCNKGHGMCYPVCGVVHIKYPSLSIEKSSPCNGGSGFTLSLSEWSLTICLTPYNRR